ncbi:hypothetical protein D9M68_661460 [compost metagenome]
MLVEPRIKHEGVEQNQKRCTEDRTCRVLFATDFQISQGKGGQQEAEVARADHIVGVGMKRPRNSYSEGGDNEAHHLAHVRADTYRANYVLVVFDGSEYFPEVGDLDQVQPPDEQATDQDHERGQVCVEHLRGKDANHPRTAAQQIRLGVDDSHHLGESEANQQEVRPLGAKSDKPEHQAYQRRDHAAGHKCNQERPLELSGNQPSGIGADSIEGSSGEVQFANQHDEAEAGGNQCSDGDPDHQLRAIATTKELTKRRQHHQPRAAEEKLLISHDPALHSDGQEA